LIDRFRRFGGELRRMSFARAEGVGAMHGWRSAMPVTQWAVTKEGAS
jgi:precorrin-6B C5,15-methyltransferase / cobalt-precorrin-6B C5,C15-methyltransferase